MDTIRLDAHFLNVGNHWDCVMNSTIAPPPSGRKVTAADEKSFPLYLQVLELVRAGTSPESIAFTVFGLKTPSRADRKMIERYYERAVWMTQTGWKQLAGGDVGNIAVYGLFSSRSISDLRLSVLAAPAF